MASILTELSGILRSKIVLNSFTLSNRFTKVRWSSNATSSPEAVTEYEDEHELAIKQRNENIEKKRNVSRLNFHDRNLVHDIAPYREPKADYHMTVRYRRRLYGRYGSQSGVNPGIMWPTKEDIELRKEYESVAYPFTIQDLVQSAVSKIEEKEANIWARQKKIVENVKKLDQWKKDLESKRAKKLEAALQEREKKERLIEEVRRHFGYTVDPREEKFQEMLEKKEKEEKRLAKLQKQKMREEKYLEELLANEKQKGG